MRGLDKFTLQEIYQDDKDVYRALYSKDNNLLRVDIRSNISEPEAIKQMEGQITRMTALFEKAVSPYPGEISNVIECGQEYKPVFAQEEINGTQVSYFTGYLNERLVFGACTEDQVEYQGIFALLYCVNQSQLIQLEIIAPKEAFGRSPELYREMLASISCLD